MYKTRFFWGIFTFFNTAPLTYRSLVFWHDSPVDISTTGKLVEVLTRVHRPVHLLQQVGCLLSATLRLANLLGWTAIQAIPPIPHQSFTSAINLSYYIIYFLLSRLYYIYYVDLCSTPECLHSTGFGAAIVSFPEVFEGKPAGSFPIAHTRVFF